MVRAEAGVLGGPSQRPGADSCSAPYSGSMSMVPWSRWTWSRWSPASSPQRQPVQAAVMTSSPADGPPSVVAWSAICMTFSGIAKTFSARDGGAAAAASAVDGVGGDEALVDGVVEHHGEDGEDAGDGGGGVAFAQVFPPGGDVDCGDVAEGGVAPAGEDVLRRWER